VREGGRQRESARERLERLRRGRTEGAGAHLGDLHLERDRVADVLEPLAVCEEGRVSETVQGGDRESSRRAEDDAPLGRVDLLGLLVRTMVGPQNDILYEAVLLLGRLVVRARGDADGLAGLDVLDDERAGRVEADTLDGGRVDLGVAQDVFAGGRDAVPDCCGGYRVSELFPAEEEVGRREARWMGTHSGRTTARRCPCRGHRARWWSRRSTLRRCRPRTRRELHEPSRCRCKGGGRASAGARRCLGGWRVLTRRRRCSTEWPWCCARCVRRASSRVGEQSKPPSSTRVIAL